MAGFSNIIDRDAVDVLIPVQQGAEIIVDLVDNFWLFDLGRRLPNLTSKTNKRPVLASLPEAYWVSGDTGLKQTTAAEWEDKWIEAEEMAVVVPIPEAVFDDADYDIWGSMKPLLVDAFSHKITQSVLYGTEIPASMSTNMGAAGLVAFATAAGSVASLADFTDFYEAVEGETADAAGDGVLALLAADGFRPTGHVADPSVGTLMRNCRDANGQKIYPNDTEINGRAIQYPLDGTIDPTEALLISGQWNHLVYAIRQDMTYTIANQGVITDAAGKVVHNLWQQDMIGMRVVMRLGFALPNPINRMEETEDDRSPFAILTA